MMTSLFHRSKFALRLASLLPGRGLTSTLLNADGSTSENKSGVRKLDYDGKPADGTQMITPLIVHKGLNYISGQGANDAGSAQRGDIESHTTKVMNNVKKLVEGGGSMDSIPQLTGHLANLITTMGGTESSGPTSLMVARARTTVSVAGVPGRSLLGINCIS